jgi:lia operon protein LiaG
LKPIYGKGTDNTGIGIKMEKNGNQITLTCLMSITKRREYKVKVPNNFSLKIKSECGRANDIIVQDMKNEVEVKTCQSIKIKNVTGSLVLATISGNIDVDKCGADKDQTISLATVSGDINAKFTEFNIKNPVSIASVSGEVDVTLSPKAAATVKMGSISGTVYSDFEFSDTGKKMKQVGGNQVDYSINGGGTELNLGTVSGNVYLRKGK